MWRARRGAAALALGALAAGGGAARAQQVLWERLVPYPAASNAELHWVHPAGPGQVLVQGLGTVTGAQGTRYPALYALYSVQGTELQRQYGRAGMATGGSASAPRPGGYWFVGNLPEYRNGSLYGFRTYVQALTARGDTLPAAVLPAAQVSSVAESLRPAPGGYVFVGRTVQHPAPATAYTHYALTKLGADGAVAWSRTYPRPGLGDAYACDVAPAAGGGFLVSGVAQVGAVFRTWLVQTDSLGRLRRSRLLPLFGHAAGDEVHRSTHNNLEVLPGGAGYVLTGYADSTGGRRTGFVARLDTALQVVWRYRRPAVQTTMQPLASKVQVQADGTLLVLEGNDSPLGPGFALVRLEAASGRVLARAAYRSPGQGQVQLYHWLNLGDGTALVAGRALRPGLGIAAYLARIALPPALAAPAPPAPAAPAFAVYPNPAGAWATVRRHPLGGPAAVRVCDALGRVVQSAALAPGQAEARLDLGNLPPGLYHCHLLQAGRVAAVQRLQIVR